MNLEAKQARKILENRDQINTEIWYEKSKYYFFDVIKNAALKGNNSIILDPIEWNEKRVYKDFLEDRLKELGYTVEYDGRMHSYGMTISW